MELKEVLTKVKNNELETMSVSELQEALITLANAGKPQDMSADKYNEIVNKVASAYSTKAQGAKGAQAQKKAEQKPEISEEQLTRNTAEMNRNAEHLTLSDDVKAAMKNMQIVKEDGSKTTAAEEITEAAKLRVAADNVIKKEPMSQKAYNDAVEYEIDQIMMAIYTARGRANPNNQSKESAQKNADDLMGLYQGQQSEVDAQVVSSKLALHVGATEEKVNQQASWFPKNKFFNEMKSKVGNLYSKLSKKLGKAFDQAKAVVDTMKKQGTLTEALVGGGLAGVSVLTAVAGASVAGAAAAPLAAAMGVYSVWTASRRISPLYKKYKEEKARLGKDFNRKAFFAQHKKEVTKAALYTGAGVLGAAAGVCGVLNSVAAAGHGLSVARAAASAGRTGLLVTSSNAPFISDLMNAKDQKERKHAAKRIAESLGTTGAILLAGWLFGHSAHAAETPSAETTDASHATGGAGREFDPNDPLKGLIPEEPEIEQVPLKPGEHMIDQGDSSDIVMTEPQYTVETAGAKEQAIYVRNLKLVPGYEKILENIKSGLVKITDGMTPEEAINHARIQAQNFGNKSILIAMKDCDGVEVDLRKALYDLHNNSWTELDGVHKLGDIKGFVGNECITSKITEVNCDTVKIVSHNNCAPAAPVAPAEEPVQPLPVEPHTPAEPDSFPAQPVADKPVERIPEVPVQKMEVPNHFDSANEVVSQDSEQPVQEAKPEVRHGRHGGHYNNENQRYNDINTNNSANNGPTRVVRGSYVNTGRE